MTGGLSQHARVLASVEAEMRERNREPTLAELIYAYKMASMAETAACAGISEDRITRAEQDKTACEEALIERFERMNINRDDARSMVWGLA